MRHTGAVHGLLIAAALLISAPAARAVTLDLQRVLLNPLPAADDLFGQSVSLAGGRALVGAQLDDNGAVLDSGRAFLFDLATGARIDLPNPTPARNDFFGLSVSLSAQYALVGAQADDTRATNAGAAYVFDAATGALLRTLTIPGAAALSDNFGRSVSIFGKTALIGVPGEDVTGASNSGAALLFDVETGNLLRTFLNPAPAADDNFGSAVSLFGDKALIGAFFDDAGASNAGSAYLFDTVTGNLLHTFANPTPNPNDTFATSIGLSADKAVIGATQDDAFGFNSGAAYVFDTASGNLLHTLHSQNPTDTEEFFGEGVAISGDLILIGAAFQNINVRDSGAAYLFDAQTGALLQRFIDPLTQNIGDRFGKAVALSGTQALIAAQTDFYAVERVQGGRVFHYAALQVAAPAPLGLMLVGLAGLGIIRRRAGARCGT